jgi:lipopolysaccharide/colanic/teichoic acid biosynthesis glycosyltransferase
VDAENTGARFAEENDPRITRVGRFIRKTRLDELPQLWNVLRGDMSLVGPRPPLPQEVEQYDARQRRRLLVKPGMTGLWQVSGRSDLHFDEMVMMDVYYASNWSLALDAKILLRTVVAVVRAHGAY